MKTNKQSKQQTKLGKKQGSKQQKGGNIPFNLSINTDLLMPNSKSKLKNYLGLDKTIEGKKVEDGKEKLEFNTNPLMKLLLL